MENGIKSCERYIRVSAAAGGQSVHFNTSAWPTRAAQQAMQVLQSNEYDVQLWCRVEHSDGLIECVCEVCTLTDKRGLEGAVMQLQGEADGYDDTATMEEWKSYVETRRHLELSRVTMLAREHAGLEAHFVELAEDRYANVAAAVAVVEEAAHV